MFFHNLLIHFSVIFLIKNELRYTEQGEVISDKYSTISLASENLKLGLFAFFKANKTKYREIKYEHNFLDELSKLSSKKYRSLIEDKNLIYYFESVTPVNLLSVLNIGSRPSKRSKISSHNLQQLGHLHLQIQVVEHSEFLLLQNNLKVCLELQFLEYQFLPQICILVFNSFHRKTVKIIRISNQSFIVITIKDFVKSNIGPSNECNFTSQVFYRF